jgi:hypothetical protein
VFAHTFPLRFACYVAIGANQDNSLSEKDLKEFNLAIDELVKENPKAKNVTPQQVIDLSFLP